MFNQKFIEEVSSKLKDLFAQSPAADIEKNLRAVLQSVFAKLDLVTREEFDVQQEVLTRTREKLTQLEAKVAVLGKKQVKRMETIRVRCCPLCQNTGNRTDVTRE